MKIVRARPVLVAALKALLSPACVAVTVIEPMPVTARTLFVSVAIPAGAVDVSVNVTARPDVDVAGSGSVVPLLNT